MLKAVFLTLSFGCFVFAGVFGPGSGDYERATFCAVYAFGLYFMTFREGRLVAIDAPNEGKDGHN
jgi:hypothetical protein